ncbi:MAG: hypothetical protein FRX49_01607 [Trebouxia sp. A1-2]|nr:MAG: hypothetical protein FRX49_01607 [Trebouxia sp. A1-2]
MTIARLIYTTSFLPGILLRSSFLGWEAVCAVLPQRHYHTVNEVDLQLALHTLILGIHGWGQAWLPLLCHVGLSRAPAMTCINQRGFSRWDRIAQSRLAKMAKWLHTAAMKAMILRSSILKKTKTPLSEKMSYTILTCRSREVKCKGLAVFVDRDPAISGGHKIQGGGLPQLSCNAKGQQQLSPALTLRPEAETVDRALAKEISRDLSLMMLAASIANTAIASLHAQQGREWHEAANLVVQDSTQSPFGPQLITSKVWPSLDGLIYASVIVQAANQLNLQLVGRSARYDYLAMAELTCLTEQCMQEDRSERAYRAAVWKRDLMTYLNDSNMVARHVRDGAAQNVPGAEACLAVNGWVEKSTGIGIGISLCCVGLLLAKAKRPAKDPKRREPPGVVTDPCAWQKQVKR